MAQLLEILHQENRLAPSALAIVKGGDGTTKMCSENGCERNTGKCTFNYCQGNSGDCETNNCKGNYIKNPNPDPSCNGKYYI